MVPYTKKLGIEMMASVLTTMVEHGVIELQEDDEATADQVKQVLREHGVMKPSERFGEMVVFGQAILMPGQDRGFALLIVTPCPTDRYGPDLKPKPSPIQFERTRNGRIILPGRWFASKLEELAENPAAPEGLRTLAINMSRRAEIPDTVLPDEAWTIEMRVRKEDGTEEIIEALPPGLIISMGD